MPESQIECLTMHLLGIGESAVNIEYQRFATHPRRTTCEPRASVSLRHSIRRQIMGVKSTAGKIHLAARTHDRIGPRHE